jgi:Fic family protein
MEPLKTSQGSAELAELGSAITLKAGALGAVLHPVSAREVTRIVEQMNCYYSNLIEGHRTHPRDVERAMRADYSQEPKKRNMQILGKAHVEVERLMIGRLEAEPELVISSPEFLRWLHAEFYSRLPDELRCVKDKSGTSYPIQPGALRDFQVEVGTHQPPDFAVLQDFLDRFMTAYDPSKITATERLPTAAAAHQRLLWIHPFGDGNGRIARLFSTACLHRAGVYAHGLWSISRGLARRQRSYYEHLNAADAPRQGDYDGRGNLSQKALDDFAMFFLETALDQIEFMTKLFDFEGMEKRLEYHFAVNTDFGKNAPAATRIMVEVLRRGEIQRGMAPLLTGKGGTAARQILGRLEDLGFLQSDGPKKPVRLKITSENMDALLPMLFVDDARE